MTGHELTLAVRGCVARPAFSAMVAGMLAAGIAGNEQRARDIAIRVALGARPSVVLRDVLSRGAALAALGAAIGVVLALWAGGLVQSLLFGVSPRDPATLAAVVLVVAAAALLANVVPARRAAAVDLNRVLRAE